MDYIPVYEDEAPQGNGSLVKISLDKVQKLGVRTEAATPRELAPMVRAVGTLQANERHLYRVTTKFEGWIETLYVNTTGETVRRGEPLMAVYSPELITAQQEYLIAWRGLRSVKDASLEIQARMRRLEESALQRLSNWDISDAELRRLRKERKSSRTLILRSPVNGVVLEKPALQGMRFMPGEMLYRIADLSSLWLLAEVYEHDLALVQRGQVANVTLTAYPGQVFSGKVTFIYPTVTPQTRTAQVRIELPNPAALLKPDMYATVDLTTTPILEGVTIPNSAVLDSGLRQVVLVARDEGLYEPREVKLGRRANGYVAVLEGVTTGENVVVYANFLIDAESNLQAALSSFGGYASHGGAPGSGATPAQGNTTGSAHAQH
jgi:Cu(I)/Ag(I) efflux system membrane fusion protein